MNLCVEAAPNTLTVPWEGGICRRWGLGIHMGISWLAQVCVRAVRGSLQEEQTAYGLSANIVLKSSITHGSP